MNMAALTKNSYGKSQVRLTKVNREGAHHELKEMSVNVVLEGEFARCYTHGDNSRIIATDSMKNTVYALARNHPLDSIEAFAGHVASHFANLYRHVSSAVVEIRQTPWQRIVVDGKPHDHAFAGGSSELRYCSATQREDSTSIESGIDDLLVLKTAQSGFVGYIHDEYTTLRETTDRIFATSLSARWQYISRDVDFNRSNASIRQALLETFATHDSLAVQQTLYAMGQAALEASASISSIQLTMPNQHRLLANLQPFGMDNPNVLFVPTSEPFGIISGTISRG
jgi:urate oxidase